MLASSLDRVFVLLLKVDNLERQKVLALGLPLLANNVTGEVYLAKFSSGLLSW
jgi:hypothetical protein